MVSVIIPTIKTEEEIADLIAEIKDTMIYELDLIVVSGNRSVAKNQNIGMDKAKGKFIIICGDDIEQLPKSWDKNLINILVQTEASMVGPRLLNPNHTLQAINYANYDLSKDFVEVNTMITALCAFRNTSLRFDENYIGSGYEDTDFCNQLGGKFFVVNTVKVVHRNECKNQFLEQNGAYFNNKWNR